MHFGPLLNLSFCSTACLAAAYKSDGWEYRKGRLLMHCEEALERRGRTWAEDHVADLMALQIRCLVDQVRAVCNLERK
jgi:hypothetical protein